MTKERKQEFMSVFNDCESKQCFYTCDMTAKYTVCPIKTSILLQKGFTQEEINKAWENYQNYGEI